MKTKVIVLVALSSATMLTAAQPEQTKISSQSQQTSSFKQTPRTIMDDEIAKNLHPIISGNWLSHGYPNVTFDVNNGTVNLRGVVDTKEEKAKVEQEVKKIEGVKAVNNQISVGIPSKPIAMNDTKTKNGAATATPSTTTPSSKDSATNDKDRSINTQIREKISKWSPKGYETLVISTSNGAVTIKGSVERVEDIQKISNDVKNVDGVKSVTNQIYVKKQ